MQNPMKMLKQVQEMQAKMAKVQAELESEQVEASAGGGAVKAVVTGAQKVVAVTIDPDLASDPEMLQDLVVAALNEALDKSREVAAQRMQAVTAGPCRSCPRPWRTWSRSFRGCRASAPRRLNAWPSTSSAPTASEPTPWPAPSAT